jgi:uncharacterized protein (TIGR00251 family)
MTTFYVKVETSSSEFEIKEDSLPKIKLTQPAENNKANSELVSRLENILGQKPAIISGHKSSRKKIKVDVPEKEVESKLGAKLI